MAGLDRQHLARVLTRLATDDDAEVLNAARQAERMRRAARISWQDLLSIQPSEAEASRRDIKLCLDNMRCLNSWEFEYLISISGFASLSPQQVQKLAVIVRKVNIVRQYKQQRRQR